jgi:hypothetical protein
MTVAAAGGVSGDAPPALGGLAATGMLAPEFFSDHASTEYAYWLWKQLPDDARMDAAQSQYP